MDLRQSSPAAPPEEIGRVHPDAPRRPHTPAEQGRWLPAMPSSKSTQRDNPGPRARIADMLPECTATGLPRWRVDPQPKSAGAHKAPACAPIYATPYAMTLSHSALPSLCFTHASAATRREGGYTKSDCNSKPDACCLSSERAQAAQCLRRAQRPGRYIGTALCRQH